MSEHEGKEHCCCHGEGHAMDHEKIKEHMEKKKQVHQEIVEKLDKIIEMLESK